MKKFITCVAVALMMPTMSFAQSALDAYSMSQDDLRGTARYMSMGGAFGALGGDISAVAQNPGGIGVYRSSDLSATLDIDMQTSKSQDFNYSETTDQTKVNFNSFGYIGSFKVNGDALRNINLGFTYNRRANFARKYKGQMHNLSTSLSNYVAGITNAEGWTSDDLSSASYETTEAPWMSILAYDGSLINPLSDGRSFQGLYGDGTKGYGEYEVIEQGGVNEFNLTLGGNIKDKLYWGMTLGIMDLGYDLYSYYGEALDNAYINDDITGVGNVVQGSAMYALENYLSTKGTGCNFKLGVIYRATNAIRIGAAFHTPTYYTMKDSYYTTLGFDYAGQKSSVETNDGYDGETWYKLRSPWRFMGSIAGVIGTKAIVSFDYERVQYNTMKLQDDYGYDYVNTNLDIRDYYKGSNIFKLGAEYRIDPSFSVRAGFSHQTSPVKEEALNEQLNIMTVSTTPAYSFDKSTQHYCLGVGYKFGRFYADLAYVHKSKEREYHAFSPVVEYNEPSPANIVKDTNDRIVLTVGVRF